MKTISFRWYCFFAACLALATATIELPPELLDYINTLHVKCLASTGKSEELHSQYDVKTNTPDMSCYMKCLMVESRWMDDDGTINYNFIINEFELFDQDLPELRDIMVNAVNQCRDVTGNDPCHKAYNFNYCIYEADQETWFLA
ncbi:pheromone-binding protein-related protein 6 [Aethina tumida]|uniref:pheromone-binding protein-related protein 6 n=1 Tax=Aethina tumida TaxID=116153 RepID=UPI002148EDC5|nr:pheromone-binding protein-related protein 6 [Aethina tumida]